MWKKRCHCDVFGDHCFQMSILQQMDASAWRETKIKQKSQSLTLENNQAATWARLVNVSFESSHPQNNKMESSHCTKCCLSSAYARIQTLSLQCCTKIYIPGGRFHNIGHICTVGQHIEHGRYWSISAAIPYGQAIAKRCLIETASWERDRCYGGAKSSPCASHIIRFHTIW